MEAPSYRNSFGCGSFGTEDLPHLSQGAPADIAVLGLRDGKSGYIDTGGFTMPGKLKLERELTVRHGRVVRDLNGLAAKPSTDARADSPQALRIR